MEMPGSQRLPKKLYVTNKVKEIVVALQVFSPNNLVEIRESLCTETTIEKKSFNRYTY